MFGTIVNRINPFRVRQNLAREIASLKAENQAIKSRLQLLQIDLSQFKEAHGGNGINVRESIPMMTAGSDVAESGEKYLTVAEFIKTTDIGTKRASQRMKSGISRRAGMIAKRLKITRGSSNTKNGQVFTYPRNVIAAAFNEYNAYYGEKAKSTPSKGVILPADLCSSN